MVIVQNLLMSNKQVTQFNENVFHIPVIDILYFRQLPFQIEITTQIQKIG